MLWSLITANISSLLILVILMMVIFSSETLVLARATQHNIADSILYSLTSIYITFPSKELPLADTILPFFIMLLETVLETIF
jgi:hypothetical protein